MCACSTVSGKLRARRRKSSAVMGRIQHAYTFVEVKSGVILQSSMEVYKSETRELIKRFLNRRLSFDDCMAALDAALADLTSRATGEQIASLRGLILKNNETVMK